MGAARVLRRSLLVWGWGHIALGDRRGWLLVVLQPLAIGVLLFAAWALIDGTRWLDVFVPLVVLLVFWIGQAAHAHRRAIALGAGPGGELQLALFLPFALAVVTAFWLLGGRHGSPAATVEAYMEAWQSGRPDIAVALYGYPAADVSDITALWSDERAWLESAIANGQQTYGAASGLDPERPFNSLRVRQISATSFAVELVRSERFETTLLGVIPTAGQRTVVVGPVMIVSVVEERTSDGWLQSSAWRIAFVTPQGAV